MDYISNIFETTSYRHDRFFNESFQLPYNFDQIKIQPNELSTFRSLNLSIEKLYSNFLYIYGLTMMANNIVPDDMPVVAGVYDNVFTWASGGYSVPELSSFSSAGLSALDGVTIIESQYSSFLDGDMLVMCSPSAVAICKAPIDNTTISVILSTNLVSIDQNLLFQNIVGASLHNNILYIADAYYSNIYKYDLTILFTDQIYPTNGLVATKLIGGTGDAEKKYEFNNISGLTIFNDKVYVLDSNNFAIKVYDLNLNFINAVQRIDLFNNNRPIAIAGSTSTNKLYIGTENNNIVVLSEDLTEATAYPFSNFLQPDEQIKNIFTSKGFENVYYVTTTHNIWKFYASKPHNPIGKYSLYRFGLPTTDSYSWAASVSISNTSSDSVYIIGLRESDNVRHFIKATDSANFANVLTIPDFEVYTLDDIKLKADEYTQTWVINKAIQKLLLNHIRLKDKIIGRFYGTFDVQNNLLLHGFFYFLIKDLDLIGYTITLENFAGNNEAFLNTVVNRGLQNIYDLQNLMISKRNTIIVDSDTSQNNTVFIG